MQSENPAYCPYTVYSCVKLQSKRHTDYIDIYIIYLVYVPIVFPIDLHDKYFPIFHSSYCKACRAYRRISNNSYTLLIRTPPFSGKRISYTNSFVRVKMKLLFYCSYSKNTSR